MEKSKRVEEINEEITAIEKLIEGMDKRKNELLKEIKELSEKIKKAETGREKLAMARKCIVEYDMMFPIINSEEKVSEELTYTSKNAKIGRFDANGNQTGLWLNQRAAAKDVGLTQAGLSYIMRTSKEVQIEKRGCYFAWVH